ncbi:MULTISPECIES: SDR family NAD(P)-dependent oxidoreductase [unclassified Saccharopolyspora]|uniref:SDR family NAD(P)-dependent oxidoreductase n=1 Tax=Saccharopolyspora TaxID=1835 RepID=UPI00190921C4|nr:SDR family oxidoreductase [Saccharopolyspora sp. HNM0986]MBK0867179.1 SDR family oxidoreductase [Saccharopolyspora sp. HNM0986]
MSRTVLVTGGGSGLGRAIAARFVQDSDRVYITGRRTEVLERTARELGGDAHALPCDGIDPDAVESAVARIDGEVDVLVNNAGGNTDFREPAGGGLKGSLHRWRANIDANLITAALMTEACDDKLASGGAVVHIGSVGADQGSGAYGSAKAALASYSVGLSKQLGPRDITSNVVAPGYIPDTEFFGSGVSQERHDHLISLTALGRHGFPDEIAGAVHFLASADARFITGQVINPNGGARTTR